MDDGLSKIIGKIFDRYGLGAIAGAAVFAVIVWGGTQYAALPGTEVHVLWGMTSYFKGGGGGSPNSTCASLEGRWKRKDGAIFRLTQNGCILTGSIESNSENSSQELHGVISGVAGAGYTTRRVDRCLTYLANDYKVSAKGNSMTIAEKGTGCGLDDHDVTFDFDKID